MLQFHFLGGFRLARDGDPIDRPVRERLQSLLALLILHAGRALPREYIAELLWPEGDPAQTLGRLRRVLFDLRHDLPEAAALLQAKKASLRWPETGEWWCDTGALQRLAASPPTADTVRAGIELYRGDLLP